MRFLLNMNLPRSLSGLLEKDHHMCRHVGNIGLGSAPDTAIAEEAARTGEVVLTHDLDYGHLLVFSGAAKPSVVIFRPANTRPAALASRLAKALPHIEKALEEGAVVVIEDAGARIRMLPITDQG